MSGGHTFVGRAMELDLLRAELTRVQAGEPRLVLISGEAGIGKTRLVEQLLSEMPDAQALRSSGDEAEIDIPYGVTSELVRGHSRTASGFADTEGADTFPQPFAIGAGLLTLLSDLQDRGSVAIVIDDVHWADAPSLRAVTFAIRRLRADRVLALLTVRPEHAHRVPPGIDRLIEGGHGRRVDLSGLTVTELGELLRVQERAPLSHLQLDRLWAHTRGNPLWAATLLHELPAHQLSSGQQPLPAPVALTRSVRRRLDECSQDARALVAAAAVGGNLPLGVLGRLAELREPFDALDEAVQAELLERRGSPPALEVRFPHPLVATAAYNILETALRTALHRRAAGLAHDDATGIRHEVAASSGQDESLSARVTEHARRRRARGDLTTAGSAFVTAAKLSPQTGARDDLLLDAAETYLMGGEVGSAMQLFSEWPELPRGRRLDYVRGWEALATGRLDEARHLLAEAWDDAGDELSGAAAKLLAFIELQSGRGLHCASWAQRVLVSTDEWHRNLGAAMQAVGLFIAGRPADAYAALEWLPEAHGVPPEALDAAVGRANMRLWDGCYDQARQDYLTILSTSRASGNLLLGSTALGNLADVEYRTGHWDDALSYAERAVSVATDLEQILGYACVHAVATPVYARRGEWEPAQQHVSAAAAAAAMLGDAASTAYAGTAAAMLAHSRRDYPALLAAVEPMVQATSRDGVDEPGVFMWRELQIEALLRLGRVGEAESALKPFEEVAAHRGRQSAMGGAARARGLLEAERGNMRASCDALEQAVSHHRAAGLPFEEGLAHLAAGAVLRRSGARRAAVQHLRAASQVFVELRAAPFAEICGREQRGCGLKPIPRSGSRQPQLTPQEMSVAVLVVSGMSNREVAAELVLSVKTVEYHLGNTFTKLDIRSRTQLGRHLGGSNASPHEPADL